LSRRALITGVSGFAGRRLAEQLVDEGWEVAGTVRSRRSGVPGVQEHVLEIDDRDGLAALAAELRPQAVFHLAAIVDTVVTPDVLELHRTNTLGTVAVLEALRGLPEAPRVLYASSAFAYGFTPDEAQPVSEDQPLRPVTPYGASKAAGEAIALAFGRETGADVMVSRAFQHTGPEHVGAYALADWAQQLAEIEARGGRGAIRCGNIDVARDYCDVRDVASAYRAIMDRGHAGTIYNVASGVAVTMRALLEGLIAAFGVQVEIEVDASRLRKVDQPRFFADVSRLRDDTGWQPEHPLDATLAALAGYWRGRVAERPAPSDAD
jgi:GDP-4-dehydro-6-deoxy-D-mannose reductase